MDVGLYGVAPSLRRVLALVAMVLRLRPALVISDEDVARVADLLVQVLAGAHTPGSVVE